MLSDGLEKIDDFVKVKSLSRVRLFVTPMDCSLPGSSVHGIFQAIVLEWIAISFSRGSSQSRALPSETPGKSYKTHCKDLD